MDVHSFFFQDSIDTTSGETLCPHGFQSTSDCVLVCVSVCVCVTSPLTLSRLSLLSTNPRRNTFSVCQSACVCCSTLFAGYLPEACELDYMLLIVCAYRPSSGSAGNYWMYAAGFQLLASFFSPYPLSSRSFNFS